MSGHTPGPWEMSAPMGRDHLYGAEPWFWVSGRHTLHIQVAAYSDGFVRGANEANARLIAAAPELLEALQWFVENDDTYQGDTPMPEHGGLTWNEINAEFIDGLNKARAAIAKATGERHETPSER